MTRILLLVCALAATACGGTRTPLPVVQATDPAQREALLLSAAPGPEGRKCNILRNRLGNANAAVDSAALMSRLASAGSATALLSVRFDSAGAVEFVHIIDRTGDAERLAELARSSFRPTLRNTTFRLKLVAGAEPALRLGHTELCMPELWNRDAISAALSASGLRVGRVVAMYLVDASGRVMEARIVERSPVAELNRIALRIAEDLHFKPGLVDGVPWRFGAAVPIHVGRNK